MPGELMIGKATNKDVNPAVRHFLAVLGAAHGGFAAALIAAAFLPGEDYKRDFQRPMFACVTLLWYAILGPLVEAMRLEKMPTLWDCLNCCFASRSFTSLDKDGDGQITEEEWREAQRKGIIGKNQKFSKMLAKGDRDGDGNISLNEFKTLHKAPTMNFPIVNAILLLALVADTGYSKYTLAALITMGVGALIFVVTVLTKTNACAKDDGEDDESVEDEEK